MRLATKKLEILKKAKTMSKKVKNLNFKIKKLSQKSIVWLRKTMTLEAKYQYREMPTTCRYKLQKLKNRLARIDWEIFIVCKKRAELWKKIYR